MKNSFCPGLSFLTKFVDTYERVKKDGFNYRTAYFLDNDNQYYRLTVSVGKNGEVNTVYNVGKIKEATVPSWLKGRMGHESHPVGQELPDTRVPQNYDGVNNKFPTGSKSGLTGTSVGGNIQCERFS